MNTTHAQLLHTSYPLESSEPFTNVDMWHYKLCRYAKRIYKKNKFIIHSYNSCWYAAINQLHVSMGWVYPKPSSAINHTNKCSVLIVLFVNNNQHLDQSTHPCVQAFDWSIVSVFLLYSRAG